MKVLSLEQVLALHDDLIDAFGGAPEIHDLGLLESALAAPFRRLVGKTCTRPCRLKPLSWGLASLPTTPSRMGTSAPELM